MGFKIKLVILGVSSGGKIDPDDLIKKSPNLWQKAVSEAVWFLDYYINLAENNFPPDSVEQKHYLSAEVLPFLGYISDPLEQDHYVHRISSKFLVSEKVIRDQLSNSPTPALSQQHEQAGPVSSNLLLQKEVFGGLLSSPAFFNQVRQQIEDQDFDDPALRQLAAVWASSVGSDLLVKQHTLAKEAVFMVESQLDELDGDQEKLNQHLLKQYGHLKINSIKRQLKALEIEIKTAEKQFNRQRVEELNKVVAAKLALRISLEKTL